MKTEHIQYQKVIVKEVSVKKYNSVHLYMTFMKIFRYMRIKYCVLDKLSKEQFIDID